jgi:hypothetical protein
MEAYRNEVNWSMLHGYFKVRPKHKHTHSLPLSLFLSLSLPISLSLSPTIFLSLPPFRPSSLPSFFLSFSFLLFYHFYLYLHAYDKSTVIFKLWLLYMNDFEKQLKLISQINYGNLWWCPVLEGGKENINNNCLLQLNYNISFHKCLLNTYYVCYM